ncbi:Hypothetical protein SMAX5B_003176 [Scophthalmus maximus]|uniref:Secreted protein n=1 Tax=Scophthalmus maximus TaxID=52904 RepID=A0A2U9CWY8_SCOMX|nr:Hypothetical protein SMAX5B_003176 [Scophthalmus maximus]
MELHVYLLLTCCVCLHRVDCSLPHFTPATPQLQVKVLVNTVDVPMRNEASRLPGLCRRLKRRRITVLVKTHVTTETSLTSNDVSDVIRQGRQRRDRQTDRQTGRNLSNFIFCFSLSVTWRSSVGGGGVRGGVRRTRPVRCVVVHEAPGVRTSSSTVSEPINDGDGDNDDITTDFSVSN